VEWTKDGWFKTPAGIKTDQPIKKPAGKNFKINLHSECDDFSGKTLKPHWKFFGEYDSSRFYLINKSLLLKAKGNSAVIARHYYVFRQIIPIRLKSRFPSKGRRLAV
jgi:hypothetical protein